MINHEKWAMPGAGCKMKDERWKMNDEWWMMTNE